MGILKKMDGDQRLYTDLQITIAEIFHLLGHPGRIKILLMLELNESLKLGEIRDNLQLSQSATSALVKQIKDTDLITGKEVGTSIHYSLNKQMWQNIRFLIQYFLDEVSSIERFHLNPE
jgi:DNA-binding transcriptional ArsR family regulator